MKKRGNAGRRKEEWAVTGYRAECAGGYCPVLMKSNDFELQRKPAGTYDVAPRFKRRKVMSTVPSMAVLGLL